MGILGPGLTYPLHHMNRIINTQTYCQTRDLDRDQIYRGICQYHPTSQPDRYCHYWHDCDDGQFYVPESYKDNEEGQNYGYYQALLKTVCYLQDVNISFIAEASYLSWYTLHLVYIKNCSVQILFLVLHGTIHIIGTQNLKPDANHRQFTVFEKIGFSGLRGWNVECPLQITGSIVVHVLQNMVDVGLG